jgi:uncharacterized protein YbaR (Trm112 family)
MQLLLTDRLACPRCGPAFGLILLADKLVERRVHDGVLGCPNCRDSFSIRDGFADLRAPPRGELGVGLAGAAGEEIEDASRSMALLGLVGGGGTVALIGQAARQGAALARELADLQIVAIDADLQSWNDVPGVSRIVAAPGLPFFSRTLRGVVVDGRLGTHLIGEACRVVAQRSRVLVVRAPDDTDRVLEESGLTVLAREPETVVAARG